MARRRQYNRYAGRPDAAPAPATPAPVDGFQPVSDGRYGSIQEFVHAATTECRVPDNQQHITTCIDGNGGADRSWYGGGCETGKDVVAKLHDGWPEGQKRMSKLMAELVQIEVHPKDRRRRRVRRDFGDSVDIHAIYSGHLETAWEIAKRQEGCGPQRLDLLVNMICSGGENADVLFWRGAAAVVLADKLEAAGYMVRLVVGFGGINGHGERTSCRITVKDHDKPLDVSSTASVILPGFFRAIGHAWLAGHARKHLYGFGISVESGEMEEQEIVLSHDVRDAGSARAWLESMVADVNAGGHVLAA